MQTISSQPVANQESNALDLLQTKAVKGSKSDDVSLAESEPLKPTPSGKPDVNSFDKVMQDIDVEKQSIDDMKYKADSGVESVVDIEHTLQQLTVMLEKLKENPELLKQLDDGSDAFQELKSFIEGNDLSALLTNNGEGLPPLFQNSLPSLSLDSIMSSLSEQENKEQVEQSENIPLGALSPIEIVKLKDLLVSIKASYDDVQNASLNESVSTQKMWFDKPLITKNELSKLGNGEPKNQGATFDGLLPVEKEKPQAAISQLDPLETSKQNKTQANIDMQFKLNSFNQKDNDFSSLFDNALLGQQNQQVTKQALSDVQIKTVEGGLKQYSTLINTPVMDQGWSEQVGQKIVWFTGRNIQSAEIHLNPADLGPIDIKIKIHNDAASVTINAQNTTVRDLLESNVYRLREMLATNGVGVSEVNVDAGRQEQSYGSPNQQQNKGRNFSGGASSNDLMSENESIEQVVMASSMNLVDYFA